MTDGVRTGDAYASKNSEAMYATHFDHNRMCLFTIYQRPEVQKVWSTGSI